MLRSFCSARTLIGNFNKISYLQKRGIVATTSTCHFSIVSCRHFSNAIPIKVSEDDEKLINRGDFNGVQSMYRKNSRVSPPETTLLHIQESLRRNFRVNGESFLVDVVLKLENNDSSLIDVLRHSSERWIPMLISSCGAPLSNVHKEDRMKILERLLAQLDALDIPLSLTAFNRYLAVMLENEHEFNTEEVMKQAEEVHRLELDQTSFRFFLEGLARYGDQEACRRLIYEMARRGLAVDDRCNESLVYCFAIRGHHAKADSLVEQAKSKYGAEAHSRALAACSRAAAARGDMDRLRTVLRRAVDNRRKLVFSTEGVFETIWLLSVKGRERDGADFINLIEQMLDHTQHPGGYFRYLFREVERHICHEHYHTAVALLEDTNRIQDCLKNQQRSLFMHQMLSRLCRQLIRNQTAVDKVNDIANRVTTMFRNAPESPRIYDELLFAALMYKGFTPDQRFEYLSAFVDSVDRARNRPHLILPILANASNVEDRLKVIFRCGAIGYKDLSDLDTKLMIKLVIQPLYNKQKPGRRSGEALSRLDQTARILRSYGISDENTWKTLHEFWKIRSSEERGIAPEAHERPTSHELGGWLREQYVLIYDNKAEENKGNGIKPTYERLKGFVDMADSTKVHSFLSSYGWPEGTNFEEIVPPVLELYIEHEEWANVKKMLTSLSGQASRWARDDDPAFSPVKNYHLLKILRRRSNEGDELSVRKLIEYCYELRRLFPNAITHYETFFDTLYEYNRLFSRCFDSSTPLTVEKVDQCIDLLRTIIKLDIIALHPNETLTTVFVNNVLRKLGWNEAVNTWMKFQSGLYCSNAMIALLRYSLNQSSKASETTTAMSNTQYVLHKAQNFLSASRVHALYLAVLISTKRYEEADKYVVTNKNELEPWDCVVAMRLMNALKFRQVDEDFCIHFPTACLEHTNLRNDADALKAMQQDWMRVCEIKNLGPLALRLYELFANHGAQLPEEERKRLYKMVGEHDKLAKRWLYAPSGFLNLKEDDEIVIGSETWRIQQKLREEIQNKAALA